MRSVLILSVLALAVSACSSSKTASSPTPTPQGGSGLVSHFPTATPGKGGQKPVPTHDPRTPLPTLRPVKTATPSAPAHFAARDYTASVYGTITDAKTHKPLPGATVQVADGQRTTHSDKNGRYRIAFPGRLTGSIQVRKPGYQCGIAMGTLKPGQSVRKDWQCQKIDPKHPVPPPFPSFVGTPAPGMQVPGPPPAKSS